MVLTDNINVLKESYPENWEKLKIFENEENIMISEIEATKKGDNTLSVIKNVNKTYLHSKYNPLREAETIIEGYKDIGEDTSIIFYGTGLGYHIKLLLEKYPNVKYYIYEPIPELMYRFLSNINLKNLQKNRLMGLNIGFEGIENNLSRFVDVNRNNIQIIELPSHKQNFIDEYKRFNEIFSSIIKNKRSSIATNYSFQKRWIINSMKNFGEVLSTPNIIIEKKGHFKGKPAILVAAGPSLNEEIENIRYIKENGLAYIFSVGSAINTLIHHDIYPDAACTYDPTVKNQMVFEMIKENNIKEIPMIFGSSVGYETLEGYLGNKYHMTTSQDTISNYYLKNEDDKVISIVQDAPSIAVVTLQLLYELGFDNIILAGQNLGYRGKKRYSDGIFYSSSDLTEEEIGKGIWVKDVYGSEILTNEGFNSMRKQMEHYINELQNIEVINTTKGGANIEGTKFVELSDLINLKLKEKIVEKNWLEGNSTKYDKKYLDLKLKNMDRSYEKVLKINKEYNDILSRIEKLIKNGNFIQAEKMYIRLDEKLKRVENNDFYKIFILPMNRVQYKILADSIDSLNDIMNPYIKGKTIVESFKKFMDICIEDIEMIKPIYEEMKNDIKKYITNDNGDGEINV